MYEDEAEGLKAALRMIRGMYEDQVIADYEVSITRPIDDPDSIPMPNTCHPTYERYAKYVMDNYYNSRPTIRMPKFPGSRTWQRDPVNPSVQTPNYIDLKRGRCWGLAPFVGDPRKTVGMYTWFVWTDNYGRHIAGEARLMLTAAKEAHGDRWLPL